MEKLVAAIVADSPRRSRLSLFLLAVHSSRRLSRSLISFAVLKRGRAFFGTDTGTPVRGLRPVRASQIVTENVPNPRSSIRLPHASAAVISSNIASTILSTSRRRRCGLRCRKRQTRSDLIIPNSLWAVAGIGNAADLGFFLMASLWPNLQCRRSCKHCVLVDSAVPVACSPACSAAFVGRSLCAGGQSMARLPVLGPTHPKAWGLFFAFLARLVWCPIRRADAAPPHPCCARRLTDGFKQHWLGRGNVPGAFFDGPCDPCLDRFAQWPG